MSVREQWSRVDRLQQSLWFKWVATALIALSSVGGFVTYWLAVSEAASRDVGGVRLSDEFKPGGENAPTEAQVRDARSDIERFNQTLRNVLSARADYSSVGTGIAAIGGLLIGAVWLGIGLTTLLWLLATGAVSGTLSIWTSTRDWARLAGGVGGLALSFSILMQLLRLAFSGPGAVLAIAKNVLAEAVRAKISLAFIVILLIALAATPSLLDPETPLRYRVQSFLQYGTGGTFWIVAVLVVLMSVATVATEQRDKVIWQTMTKPVASWEYILGKWLGVVALAGALLAVSGVGVFLFVEYLRQQPAQGETGAYMSRDGLVSEDRLWLETQVLAARVSMENEPLDLERTSPEEFRGIAEGYMDELKRANSSFDPTDPRTRADVLESLRKALQNDYRSLPTQPIQHEYTFKGLSAARRNNLPITVRFRVDSGSNRPDVTYKVTFEFERWDPIVRTTPLGQAQTFVVPPVVVREDGTVAVKVMNGFVSERGFVVNPEALNFPKQGLSVSFSPGSYRINFARVMCVLWVKLAFLAMIGVFAGTFLSFSVASLVAFVLFWAAESAPLITRALEVFDEYDPRSTEQKLVLWRWAVVSISKLVTSIFKVYGDLQPTGKLIDGVLLSWGGVAVGAGVLGGFTVIFFFVASTIFKRRELAIYSGN